MKFKIGDKVSIYETKQFTSFNPRYTGTVEYALNGTVRLKGVTDIFQPDKHGEYKNQDKTLIIRPISEYEKQLDIERKEQKEKERKFNKFMDTLSISLSKLNEYQLSLVSNYVQSLNGMDDD